MTSFERKRTRAKKEPLDAERLKSEPKPDEQQQQQPGEQQATGSESRPLDESSSAPAAPAPAAEPEPEPVDEVSAITIDESGELHLVGKCARMSDGHFLADTST